MPRMRPTPGRSMSTSTSQASDPGTASDSSAVVLWWGAEIRVLGPDGTLSSRTLTPREDPVGAILEMMAALASGSVVARIAYHPASIELREVGCPDTGKGRILRSLSGEVPALKAAGTLWAVDPVGSGPVGHRTLLYIDVRSGLPRLIDGLARLGIPTVGAWTLQSVVEAGLPRGGSDGAFWAVVAVPGRALVSCASTNGERLVHYHDGRAIAEGISADIGRTVALHEGAGSLPAICALEEGPGISDLQKALGPAGAEACSIACFLGFARLIPPGGRSDFLPESSRFPSGKTVVGLAAAAGILLLAASAWFAFATWREQEQMRRSAGEAGDRLARLRVEVGSRRATEDRILRLERSLGRLQARPQRVFELLATISRMIPPQVEIEEISAEDCTFVVRGRCEESTTDPGGPRARFRRDLASGDLPWTLTPETGSSAGPDFLWHGIFR